ncbi:MAG: hypothetical protein WDN72_05190 [Alphaproteobacteria bacterium]
MAGALVDAGLGYLAANAHEAEIVLDHALDAPGDLADAELGLVVREFHACPIHQTVIPENFSVEKFTGIQTQRPPGGGRRQKCLLAFSTWIPPQFRLLAEFGE